jgi:protein-S-isoprenylcysteine O-methyltransferase Ste14
VRLGLKRSISDRLNLLCLVVDTCSLAALEVLRIESGSGTRVQSMHAYCMCVLHILVFDGARLHVLAPCVLVSGLCVCVFVCLCFDFCWRMFMASGSSQVVEKMDEQLMAGVFSDGSNKDTVRNFPSFFLACLLLSLFLPLTLSHVC